VRAAERFRYSSPSPAEGGGGAGRGRGGGRGLSKSCAPHPLNDAAHRCSRSAKYANLAPSAVRRAARHVWSPHAGRHPLRRSGGLRRKRNRRCREEWRAAVGSTSRPTADAVGGSRACAPRRSECDACHGLASLLIWECAAWSMCGCPLPNPPPLRGRGDSPRVVFDVSLGKM
jgi:hypothetical protein